MGQRVNSRLERGRKGRADLNRAPAAPPVGLRPELALALPLTFTLLLIGLGLLPAIRRNPILLWSFCGAGAMLLAWNAVTLAAAWRRGRTLVVEVVLRKQHYLQACAHLSILLYWGWYWRVVYDSALLIVGQLLFAYAFDALLTWSRRDTYILGFGPFPIIFSTNLFLWFKPDWFYLQFAMVAVGFAAKELIRWNKEGRQTHIFNPSSFTLTLFSLVLLVTGTTGISWGQEISTTQYNPPHIFLWIFLVTLPAQFLFGTAAMTLSAVATTYTFGLAYFAATGSHFFFQEPIPIAVFLGMHLLFTDPSTSPRTELGRIIFGVLYGSSVVGLIVVLMALNVPGFYDKLLPVPILNLMIRGIDRAARSDLLKRFDPGALGKSLMPRQRNLVYMSVWVAIFVTMQALTGARESLIRGDLLLEQGRTGEAIARYREFVGAAPTDSEGRQRLGAALMQAGQLDEATASLRRAIELQPNSQAAYNNLGAALMRTGRFPEAVASLQHALELQPDNPEARKNLGQALLRAGRFADAVASLQRAVDLQPNDPEARDILGQALIQAGRSEDAVAAFQRAVDLQPGSPDAQGHLGLALMQAGRIEDAVTALQRAVDLQPNSPDAQRNLAVALRQAGRVGASVTPFQRAVDLQPDSPEAHEALGSALIEAGQFKEAAVSLQRAVELKPDYPEARYNLAHALVILGQRSAAIDQLRQALRERPDWPPALTALAELEATPPGALRPPAGGR
jgi:Flp pilus assembly protein TadD